jgi:hypothetical protein
MTHELLHSLMRLGGGGGGGVVFANFMFAQRFFTGGWRMRDDCSCLTSRVSASHILALGLDLAGTVHHVVFHLNENDFSTANIAALFSCVSGLMQPAAFLMSPLK